MNFEKAVKATDEHRSEGVAKQTGVTQQVKDYFHKNLCSSVLICGLRFSLIIQLPDLG
jgi:hypothetical protein